MDLKSPLVEPLLVLLQLVLLRLVLLRLVPQALPRVQARREPEREVAGQVRGQGLLLSRAGLLRLALLPQPLLR